MVRPTVREFAVHSSARADIWFEISILTVRPIIKSAVMSTLTAHCTWEDHAVLEITSHPPSYAEAKKLT